MMNVMAVMPVVMMVPVVVAPMMVPMSIRGLLQRSMDRY
jgi:hypothetical protein